jgi:hypothetical protein
MPPSRIWSEGGPVITENRIKKSPCLCLQQEGVVGGWCLLIVPILIAPHKQLLMAVVGGTVVVALGSLSPCPWHRHCCPALIIAVVVILPAIHPMSSCL